MPTISSGLRAAVITAAPTGTKPDGTPVSLGARIWRDSAPDDATLPYVTFGDVVDDVALSGDGCTKYRGKQQQWDLWQRARDESDDLLAALVRALAKVDLNVTQRTTRAKATTVQRLQDPDALIAHHAITVKLNYGA